MHFCNDILQLEVHHLQLHKSDNTLMNANLIKRACLGSFIKNMFLSSLIYIKQNTQMDQNIEFSVWFHSLLRS